MLIVVAEGKFATSSIFLDFIIFFYVGIRKMIKTNYPLQGSGLRFPCLGFSTGLGCIQQVYWNMAAASE